MTAGSAASRRVLGWTPVAPLPASSPTRPTGITGRMSAPPETSSPGVCSFRLPLTTYDTRTTFRRLRAHATPAAARAFRRSYYGRTVRPADRRAPLTWSTVPVDYDVRIRAVRRSLGLSQARFTTRVGAARKAVVYQWEARKRCPSPVFWQRIAALHRRLPERP